MLDQDSARQPRTDEPPRTVQESERIRLILEPALDAVVTMDSTGLITGWNKEAEKIFGWSREEAVGRPMADTIIPHQHRDAHEHGLRRFLDTGEGPVLNKRIEITALHRDGREFPVELAIAPAKVDGIWTFSAFIRDISDRKRAAEMLEERQRQLVKAKEAAEDLSRAKSEFLANMSHEIRTPMNGIIGMTSLVLDSELTLEQRECLGIVQSSAESLLKIISDTLDFSQIEARKLEMERIEFNLHASIEGIIKALSVAARQKDLELACHVGPDVPQKVIGDPGRLQQILLNLLNNGIKFTARGEVSLQVQKVSETDDGVELHFSVRDTGVGIPFEKQQLVFQAFTQVDSSSTRLFGGTGLGLATVSHLVEMMRGRIWLESELGKGSTFHFTVRFG